MPHLSMESFIRPFSRLRSRRPRFETVLDVALAALGTLTLGLVIADAVIFARYGRGEPASAPVSSPRGGLKLEAVRRAASTLAEREQRAARPVPPDLADPFR